MNADASRVTIAPSCDQWAGLAERSYATLDERSKRFRIELGLPTNRPIVMTGHQAEWWHCGVLAKFLAVDGVCRRSSLAAAWIIPDQDEAHFAEVRVPALDDTGRLRVESVALTERSAPGVVAGAVGAFRPAPQWPSGERPALESVRTGLARVSKALNAHSDSPTAAEQIVRALSDLLQPLSAEPTVLFATRVSRTAEFRSLIERFRAEPRRAAETYNRAAAAHPDAGVGPLKIDGDRVELPLWRIGPDGSRRRVFASDLASTGFETLAPRALVLTGLMRWGACDLFVHGTGGAAYDPITEQWLGEWHGATLAPIAMATADVLLPLPGAEVSDEDAARAAWLNHAARHNPGLVGDEGGQDYKRDLVAMIADKPRRSPERAAAFRVLHMHLRSHQLNHAQPIDRIATESALLRAQVAQSAVARDRTWAFFLHEPAAIEALRDRLCAGAPHRQACGAR